MIGFPADVRQCRARTRIGLIDTAVSKHPALNSTRVRYTNFVKAYPGSTDSMHGTAVASILVGTNPGTGPLTSDATLYSANVFYREQGKLRCIGITEAFSRDPGHRTLQQAVRADCWDVMMVGFSLLNQSARSRVFPHTQARNIGVLGMFAVRTALSQTARLRAVLAELKDSGQLAAEVAEAADPLGFLTQRGKAASLPEAAYRYCRHEPGIDVVLTGTGKLEHLQANVAALLKPPLIEEDVRRLSDLFGQVDSVSGN